MCHPLEPTAKPHPDCRRDDHTADSTPPSNRADRLGAVRLVLVLLRLTLDRRGRKAHNAGRFGHHANCRHTCDGASNGMGAAEEHQVACLWERCGAFLGITRLRCPSRVARKPGLVPRTSGPRGDPRPSRGITRAGLQEPRRDERTVARPARHSVDEKGWGACSTRTARQTSGNDGV